MFYNDKSNFNIVRRFTLIAHSDKYVLCFIFTPQFNKLNVNNILCEVVFNMYCLKYCVRSEQKNTNRYNNKKIVVCVFTLDLQNPILYEFDISKENPVIKDCIKDYLINKYSDKHQLVLDFYKHCKKNAPDDIDGLTHTKNQLENKYEYKSVPKYISEFLYDLKKDIDSKTDKDRDVIINNIKNDEWFINRLHGYLRKTIDKLIDPPVNKKCDY
jgi:hypothetical protein